MEVDKRWRQTNTVNPCRSISPISIMKIRILWGAALLAGIPVLLHAWDGCGHKTVAAITYERLSPSARAKVDQIFADDPRGRKFIDAATWPDDIKQGKRNGAPSA